MNRRSLLKAMLAALVAGAVPVAAVAGEESPLMKAFTKWEAMYRFQNSPECGSMTEQEYDTACDDRRALERAIWEMPARTAQEVLAKVIVETNFGLNGLYDEHEEPGFWAEARALVA